MRQQEQAPKTSISKVRVRYQETDQMGVVYHSNYLVWFEIGRTKLVRDLGFSYRELEKKGILLPVVEAHANYRYPARYDDEIRIETKIKELTKRKIVFSYQIFADAESKLLAQGYTRHIWVSKEMKPISLNDRFPEFFEELCSV